MIAKIDESKNWYYKKDEFNEKDLILNNFEGFLKFSSKTEWNDLKRGKYLCKKNLVIDDLSKNYYLVFEGVFEHIKLFINGLYVIVEKGKTIKNKTDITRYLREGTNEISVILNDFEPAINIPSCCYLEVYPKKHIIEYYFYYDKSNWYLNLHPSPGFNGSIKVVLKDEKELINQEYNENNISGALPELKLWSPKNPHLYDLEISLVQDGIVIDQVVQKIGFRYFEFIDDNYYLNDELVEDIIFTKLDEHDNEFLNHCDQSGKIVIEGIICEKWYDQEIMIENAANLIVSSRYHPSICAWKANNINSDVEKIIKVLVNLIDPLRMVLK